MEKACDKPAGRGQGTAQGRDERRRRRGIWAAVVIGIFVLFLVAIVIGKITGRFAGTTDPRLIGRWYSRALDGQMCIVWLENYRSGGRAEIDYQAYGLTRDADGRLVPSVSYGRYQLEGTWTMVGDRLTLRMVANSSSALSIPEKIRFFLEHREWLGSDTEPLTLRVSWPDPDTKVAGEFGAGFRLRGVRVPADFELPTEPLAPDAALAWYKEKSPLR